MKGKNFSGNNLGQRKKSDFYETPYSITEQFLDVGLLHTHASTLEPACGRGAIVKVLKDKGIINIHSYDKEVDFLTEKQCYEQIITNPPFSLADDFILKAKNVALSRFSFLLPLSYLHGKSRYDNIWTDRQFPLASIHVFTRYPMLGDDLRSDGCYRTGMMVYAWYHWEKEHQGSATINWLDNQCYVLKGKQ
jgi:hypothetical protein